MLIAIDGPAGAGKSTVARTLARELGFTYLDSGAMYRGVALRSLREPNAQPAELARAARIEFRTDPADRARLRTILDGEDVSERIRESDVAQVASRVASDPGVRAALVAKQRELIGEGDWVAEGRDIGTVVAPEAELKVFLTASPEERARRRAEEAGADPARVLSEQAARDERDSTRAHSPLRPAPGSVTIDTTALDQSAVVTEIAAMARKAIAKVKADGAGN
ncbi:MAG TPA: (d)CMP kinase [Solirubrobacteraceae bacterium]|nr:(d)CMP kinase [Solirubrobacteraceae bacterium]